MSTKKEFSLTNSTFSTAKAHQNLNWVLTQVVTFSMLVFCLWSSLSIYVYTRRKKIIKKKRNDFNKLSLMVLAVVIPAVTAARVLITQVDLVVSALAPVDHAGDSACHLVSNLTTVMFVASITPMYLFLWVRQRTVYSQPSMEALNTLKVKLVSYLTLFQFFVVGIPATAFRVNNSSYQMTEKGCVKKPSESGAGKTVGLIFISNLVVTQVVLLLLFVYPLSKYYLKNSESVRTKCHGLKNSCNEKLKKAIGFSAFCTLVCSVCEVTALMLATMVLPELTPRYIISCIFDMSLLANLVSLILSFDNYKSILLMKSEESKKKIYKQVSGLRETHHSTNISL